MDKKFNLGDRVYWCVRGKTHIGTVTEVVPANKICATYRDSYGVPGLRSLESYVVSEAGRLMYPRTNHLERA